MNLATRHPIIFSEGKHAPEDVKNLKKTVRVWEEIDIYEKQLKELFDIVNPSLIGSTNYKDRRAQFLQERKEEQNKSLKGSWVYFPWSGILLHMINQSDYNVLRTNRNRNLITLEEQKKLLDTPIGIIGLSIGSSTALNLVYNGLANILKLAEFDTLETTNLNRLRSRADQVGKPKIEITSQQIYEANPYTQIYEYPMGLQKETLVSFVAEKPKPRIIFEAIDDFQMKVLLRLEAKKHNVPVVMLTNLGDSILIDIERYDIDPATKPFNGLVSRDAIEAILEGKISKEKINHYVLQIVGLENVPQKAIQSLQQIGKTLVGRPQLMSTVTIASGVASFLAKKIILGDPIPSGRKLIRFDDFLHD